MIEDITKRILSELYRKQETVLEDLATAGIDPRIVRFYPQETNYDPATHQYSVSVRYDLNGGVK